MSFIFIFFYDNILIFFRVVFLYCRKDFIIRWNLLIVNRKLSEVYSSYSAVRVNLNAQGLYVVRSVCPAGEVSQVEMNLIPPFIKFHRNCAYKRLHSGVRLLVRRSEATLHVLIINDLYFEGEIFLQIFDQKNKEGHFYT